MDSRREGRDQGSAILLVANRTANADRLLDAVRHRATHGAGSFHLVVPAVPHGLHRVVDPEVAGADEARAALDAALPALEKAAVGCGVTGEVGCADPLAAIQDAMARGTFHEIVVSTLPRRVSRWLRVDLPSKARGLGLPVVHVEADEVPGTIAV